MPAMKGAEFNKNSSKTFDAIGITSIQGKLSFKFACALGTEFLKFLQWKDAKLNEILPTGTVIAQPQN